MENTAASTSRLSLPPVGLWTGALDMVPANRARQLAAELEGLGYGAIWVPEVAGRDPFVRLALLLSATDRIICATGIASIWARDAVTTSCAATTLTEAFPERVVVGLGASHANLVTGLRGHDYDKPLTAMRAYLDGIERAPYTAHRPETPVRYVLAALRRRMLGLAGERTAGAHPLTVTTTAPFTVTTRIGRFGRRSSAWWRGSRHGAGWWSARCRVVVVMVAPACGRARTRPDPIFSRRAGAAAASG